jgi:sugar phosphate isomerase/epimerase
MALRIGNQTTFAAPSALDPFEFAIAHGFRAFEFFPDRGPAGNGGWDERALSSAERDYIKRAALACDLQLTVHAPLTFDPLRDPNDSRLHSTVEFARDIGAVLLNLHLDLSQGVDAFARSLGPALEATRMAELQLALENTVWTGPEDFNQFFRHLDQTMPGEFQHVGMCFDMGHANACAATRNDYCGFLDRLAPHVPVTHLHLHENYGDRDSHLTLFTGPSRDSAAGLLGMVQRLDGRGFDGCGIMEQWPQPPSLLVEARNKLAALLATIT